MGGGKRWPQGQYGPQWQRSETSRGDHWRAPGRALIPGPVIEGPQRCSPDGQRQAGSGEPGKQQDQP